MPVGLDPNLLIVEGGGLKAQSRVFEAGREGIGLGCAYRGKRFTLVVTRNAIALLIDP